MRKAGCLEQSSFAFETSSCPAAVKACTPEDLEILEAVLGCLEGAGVCSQESADAWTSAQAGCWAYARSVSTPCAVSLWKEKAPSLLGETPPANADAGLSAITDGGHGVELVAVADETSVALAWTAYQEAPVSSWQLHAESAAAVKYPTVAISRERTTFEEIGLEANTKKSFFLVGTGADGNVAQGEPSSSAGSGEGSASGCQGPSDCSLFQVCDLGVCRTQACRSDSTCPSGYACFEQNVCRREASSTPGGPDAGVENGGAFSLPMISQPVSVRTSRLKFDEQRIISGFSAGGPQVVAFDTARQFIAVEQENQLWGHRTFNRGKTFESAKIDTLGTRIRLAFEPAFRLLYACYNVGYGTRVRVSRDLGRTWQPEVLTLENPVEDASKPPLRIRDCDIAPWKDGQALLLTIEGEEQLESLEVRTLGADLKVLDRVQAFASRPTLSGNVFGPRNVALATLPEASVAHVGFTAKRTLSSGLDTEVHGLFRAPTTGGKFVSVGRINDNSISNGNPQPQDHVALVIDPKTQRALAAFGSYDVSAGEGYSTVYVSMFNPTTQRWVTGSDLSVFYRQSVTRNYVLFCDGQTPPACERSVADAWNAFSPDLAITPSGKIYLSFLAGKVERDGGASYRPYIVPFDFNAPTPANAAVKGWFVPPALRGGQSLAQNPRLVSGQVGTQGAVLATDAQISAYVVYIEGVGSDASVENRPVMVSIP